MEGRTKLIISCDFELTQQHLSSLMTCYQAISDHHSVGLFLTFYSLRSDQRDLTWADCSKITGIYIDQLEHSLIRCEEMQLIRSYTNGKATILVLVCPLTPKKFLNHDLFGRYFLQLWGKDKFLQLRRDYSDDFSVPEEFKEITHRFDVNCLTAWNDDLENDFTHSAATTSKRVDFDLKLFLLKTTPLIFPEKLRTPEVLNTIETLGNLYKVNDGQMRSYVGNAINTHQLTIDLKYLEQQIRNTPQHTSAVPENPYLLTPFEFLQFKQNGVPLVSADTRLIESLINDLKMEEPVINVLIEYVLETNNQSLSAAYVKKIAATWVRRNVKSIDDALQQIKGVNTEDTKKKTKQGKQVRQPVIDETETATDEQREQMRAELQQLLKGE